MRVDMLGADTTEPIIFSEWSLVTGSLMKRRDFRLDVLMGESDKTDYIQTQMSFFSDSVNDMSNWEYDYEINKPMPKPVNEYPLTEYRRLAQ